MRWEKTEKSYYDDDIPFWWIVILIVAGMGVGVVLALTGLELPNTWEFDDGWNEVWWAP